VKRRCEVCMEAPAVWDRMCGRCLNEYDKQDGEAQQIQYIARRARRFERARAKGRK